MIPRHVSRPHALLARASLLRVALPHVGRPHVGLSCVGIPPARSPHARPPHARQPHAAASHEAPHAEAPAEPPHAEAPHTVVRGGVALVQDPHTFGAYASLEHSRRSHRRGRLALGLLLALAALPCSSCQWLQNEFFQLDRAAPPPPPPEVLAVPR